MNIFTAIRDHSRRGYYAAQALIVFGALSPLATTFLPSDTKRAVEIVLSLFSLVAIAAGLAMVHYLRASLRFRLDQASLAEEERQLLLQSDALTGAMSRRHFLDSLKQGLGNPLNANPSVLLLVDFDHFKQLNDSFGHAVGDAVLSHVVRALRHYFPGCAVGRLGGDEFAVHLPGGDVSELKSRAERLLRALAEGIEHDGHRIGLSVSMGAALSPVHASQPKDLMLHSDLALYESKAGGRGRLTIFDTEMLSEKRHRRLIERELRAAIYLNQLELHYQPVVNADGTPFAVEGLVRWRHPVRGIISPAEFVPIAESSGLIDELGSWVFRRACLDSAQFPGLRVSINVSGHQLKNPRLIAHVRRMLADTGCEATNLVIEITETVATAATPEIIARIEELRAMGIRIALDDFGTGHCGFNYLKTLPIDSIKVDRSYIQHLADDHIARVFVSAVAEIGRFRNMTVVAEGVETTEELRLAKTAGCNRFQGYLIAKPAPKDEVVALVAKIDHRVRSVA